MGVSVGIVGGGAAGMMAAVTAAGQGAEVTLIEGNDRLGKKILSTGNGKCNLGNEKLSAAEYYTECPEFLERCLRQFDTRDTIDFFRGIGLLVKSKNGYLYPACEQAAAVLDVLRFEVRERGVRVATDCKITGIEAEGGDRRGIRVRGDGQIYRFDRVILACGGCAAPKTGSDGSGYELARRLGHSLVPVVPALVQLRCREDYFKAVAGVRADALLSVYWRGRCVAAERGELQLTDYGISGIPVFQLSRVVNRLLAEGELPGKVNRLPAGGELPGKANRLSAEENLSGGDKRGLKREAEVVIDFLPDWKENAFERLRAGRQRLGGQRTVEEYFTGVLHKKLILLFIKLAGLKPGQEAGTADPGKVERVWELCRRWKVHVTGSNSFDNAQVCAGGVPLEEVSHSLESKRVPGVYFAGELLDVDGRCGGYNLQWAWCSGYLAGRAAGTD